jgi:glycosyltransferase involved in cell wall biosynthesis
VAKKATLCILPNEERSIHFKRQTGTLRPILCVWNCPRREEAVIEAEKNAEKFIVFYHGSLSPTRLPLAAIRALALISDEILLRFAAYETVGNQGYLEEIDMEAARLGVLDRVEYIGVIGVRAELLAQCRRAHLGLSFMPLASADLSERFMTGASNKAFDYLACGLVLLVSELPDWKTIFVEPGYGLACNPEDPESIARALRWFIENPEARSQMARNGQNRILSGWNYENQFAVAKEYLGEMKGSRKRSDSVP